MVYDGPSRIAPSVTSRTARTNLEYTEWPTVSAAGVVVGVETVLLPRLILSSPDCSLPDASVGIRDL